MNVDKEVILEDYLSKKFFNINLINKSDRTKKFTISI